MGANQVLGGYVDKHYIKDSFDPAISGDESSCIGEIENMLIKINSWMSIKSWIEPLTPVLSAENVIII